MKKASTTNTFTKGLVMDLSPLETPNNVLTNCLNGTIITYNGNDNVLLNDMGNAKVHSAQLPTGYIPLGTTELGGIIYIVSYNPQIDKCQIGSFPSPLRNITTDELGKEIKLDIKSFYEFDKNNLTIYIKQLQLTIELTDSKLSPGDKFLIYSSDFGTITDSNVNSIVSDYATTDNKFNSIIRYLKFNVVAISDDGKIANLNDTLEWQSVGNDKYYYMSNINLNNTKNLVEEYNNLTQSNYNVLQTRNSSKIGIIAKLECIDAFDVSWDAVKNDDGWDIYLYLNWTYENGNAVNLYGISWINSKGTGVIENIPLPYKNRLGIKLDLYDLCSSNNNFEVLLLKSYNNIYDYINDHSSDKDNYITNAATTNPRKNDGTDTPFIYKFTNISSSEDFTATIYPMMPFGVIKSLGHNIHINAALLGTGIIDLIQYKYFVDDNYIQLKWGLDVYAEMNKSIELIEFKFYEIDTTIINTLKSCTNDTFTKILTSNLFETANPTLTIIKSKKPSFSGYFSERISRELFTNDYVYVVEIAITYGNEMKYYYRILNNSQIFNSYFNTKENFSEIELSDILANNVEFTYEINTVLNTTKFESEIPTLSETQKTEFTTYNIKNNYKAKYKYNLSIPTKYGYRTDIFQITPLSSTLDVTNNAVLDYLYNGLDNKTTLEAISRELSQGTDSISKSTFILNIGFSMNIPFKINYATQKDIPALYKLEPLKSTSRWLLFRGDDWTASFSLYNSFDSGTISRNYALAEDYYGKGVMDNQKVGGTIYDEMPNCCKYLEELLDDYDVVMLGFTTAHDNLSEKGNPDLKLHFLQKDLKKDGDPKCYVTNDHHSDSWDTISTYNGAVLYAMKNKNGRVIIFSFEGKNTVTGAWLRLGNYYPNTTDVGTSALNPLLLLNSGINTLMQEESETPTYMYPLSGLYVPRTTDNTVSRYEWSTIAYYPNFSATIDFRMLVKLACRTFINNGILLSSTITINNLKLSSLIEYLIHSTELLPINTTNLILSLTNVNTELYILNYSGDVLNKDIKITNIYDNTGTIVKYINNWSNSNDGNKYRSENAGTPNSLYLSVDLERAYISNSKIQGSQIGRFLCRVEKLGIDLHEIPIIPIAHG